MKIFSIRFSHQDLSVILQIEDKDSISAAYYEDMESLALDVFWLINGRGYGIVYGHKLNYVFKQKQLPKKIKLNFWENQNEVMNFIKYLKKLPREKVRNAIHEVCELDTYMDFYQKLLSLREYNVQQ